MAQSKQSEIGEDQDSVELLLNGERLGEYENYEVTSAIMTQPAAFAMRVGSGGTVAELIRKYPPNTPFQLRIGGRVIQTGALDGFDASNAAGGTSITFAGRDALARLHDGAVLVSLSFENKTYRQLTEDALMHVGLLKKDGNGKPDKADSAAKLVSTDIANRMAITGHDVVAGKASDAPGVDAFVGLPPELGGTLGGPPKSIPHRVYAHISDRWYDFLNDHLGRAGLFLWAAADGTFVLTAPDRTLPPTFRITRKRGQTRDEVNVLNAHFKCNVSHRFSSCRVYGRGGGKKFGVATEYGEYVDPQMTAPFSAGGYGFQKDDRPLVLRDVDAKDAQTANYHARRRLAEAARHGWALSYTFAGHQAPTVNGGMAVWTPNLMAEIDDEEFGIKGRYWIESVTYRRGPATTTQVILMDPNHLIFAAREEAA